MCKCSVIRFYDKKNPCVDCQTNQNRPDKSLWYLKNADMTVTEIAWEAGFSGSSYYAETFRKWYHRSPTEYRKTCGAY